MTASPTVPSTRTGSGQPHRWHGLPSLLLVYAGNMARLPARRTIKLSAQQSMNNGGRKQSTGNRSPVWGRGRHHCPLLLNMGLKTPPKQRAHPTVSPEAGALPPSGPSGLLWRWIGAILPERSSSLCPSGQASAGAPPRGLLSPPAAARSGGGGGRSDGMPRSASGPARGGFHEREADGVSVTPWRIQKRDPGSLPLSQG